MYRCTDVIVNPSFQETLCLWNVAATAVGISSVTFGCCGIREYAAHKITAFIADEASPESLGSQIYYVLTQPEEAVQVALNARTLIELKFDVRVAAQNYASYYCTRRWYYRNIRHKNYLLILVQ